VTLHDFGSWLI